MSCCQAMKALSRLCKSHLPEHPLLAHMTYILAPQDTLALAFEVEFLAKALSTNFSYVGQGITHIFTCINTCLVLSTFNSIFLRLNST